MWDQDLEEMRQEIEDLKRLHDFFVTAATKAVVRLQKEQDKEAKEITLDLKSYIFSSLFESQ